jgi:ATP-dependent Clp protease ATP-binding subunit ClpC
MPDPVIQIITVCRSYPDGTELVDGLGFPEISAVGDSAESAERLFCQKAKVLLSDPELCPAASMYRRRLAIQAEIDSVMVEFDPPKRSPDWEKTAVLTFAVVRWAEREDLFHAFVPELGIQVMAHRPELLMDRVRAHIRLVLISRHKRLTLSLLTTVQRVDAIRLGQVSVSAHLPEPREIELTSEQSKKATSVLSSLADELPPLRKATAAQLRASQVAIAYEMETALGDLVAILSGSRPRSVLLVGPPGCGKTAMVQELARNRAAHGFAHTTFWTTTGSRLMRGQVGFGMWQERCQQLCQELSRARAILHVGSLFELQEVGRLGRGGQSVADFIRPWLARGDMVVIAECTPSQLGALRQRDPHLINAFVLQEIQEPTPEALRQILSKLWTDAPGPECPKPVEALDWLYRLHARYATYSANPGRPVRFLKQLLADAHPQKNLTVAEVIRGFSRETGLPTVLLDDETVLDLEVAREWFTQRVIGQTAAVDRVLDILVLIKTRMARPRRPLASLLLIGPTGTGKTELARSLAAFLFGDASRLARFDLSEFGDVISVQRLIGGLGAGSPEGLLTARIREQPFSVLLLDEFEKADASFFDLLLQILGEGRLTDASGRVADFCNAVIVMTSNLGAESVRRGPSGFGAASNSAMGEPFADAVRQFLRPEIYNRLDSILPFAPLSQEVVMAIARRQMDLVLKRDGLAQRSVTLDISPEVIEHLAIRGYDVRYGARPLKRRMEQEFVAPLAAALNGYEETAPVAATVSIQAGTLSVALCGKAPASKRSPTAYDGAADLTRYRRQAARLRHSAEVRAIENQISLLEALQKSLVRKRGSAPADKERVARLPELHQCIAAVETHIQAAQELESDYLLALYAQEAPFSGPSLSSHLNSLSTEYCRLQRWILRLMFDRPDDVVLAIVAEPRHSTHAFATAYGRLLTTHGELIAAAYFTPSSTTHARSKTTTLTRHAIDHPNDRFSTNTPPVLLRELSKALPTVEEGQSKPKSTTQVSGQKLKPLPWQEISGVVFQARGPLLWALIQEEHGLNSILGSDPEVHALVQVQPTGFEAYHPPAIVHKTRGIATFNVNRCRAFDLRQEVVDDATLGKRPWNGEFIDEILRILIEERLTRRIRAIGGEP